MRQSWDDIVAKYRSLRESWGDDAGAVIGGMEQVSGLIANGSLRSILFAWTSMHDLCSQQTDVDPRNAGPYLRISPEQRATGGPRHPGMILFTYIDTRLPRGDGSGLSAQTMRPPG